MSSPGDLPQTINPVWNLPTYWTCAGCGCFVKIGDVHTCPRSIAGTGNYRYQCPNCLSSPCLCAPTPAPTGWTCPRCARVYAPHVSECAACNADAGQKSPAAPKAPLRGATGLCGASGGDGMWSSKTIGEPEA